MSKKKKILIGILIIILIILFLIMLNKKETVYTISLQNGKEIVILKTDKEGMLLEPENPTKEGYVFLGWYLENEKVDFSKPFTQDSIIIAKWGVAEEKPNVEDIQPEIEEPEEEQQTEKPVVQKPAVSQKPQTPQVSEKEDEEEQPQIIEVTNVTISATTLNLEVGQNSALTVKVNPSNAANSAVTWTSSDTSVATVDNNGKVTAVSPGTATIKVTSGGKTASCIVTVKNKVIYSVEWVKLEGSAIEQYKLYIKSSEGEYVSGTLELTTIAGATFQESVTENGSVNAYVKSAIETVKII